MKLILSLSFQLVLYCLCIYIDDVYGQTSSRRDIPNLEEIFSWKQITYNFENDNNVISNRYGFPRRDQGSEKVAFPTEKSTTTANGQAIDANQQLQPPAIVIFDLNTNRILRRFEITEDILVHNTTTGLASITVDIDNRDCNNAHAYIPDLSQYGLIVYSFRKNRAWRVRHNYFYLDPQGGDYEINGLRFQWNDGVFSVALTSKLLNNAKAAIFHPMSGTKEYAVSTNILKDEDLATRDFHGDDFMLLGDRGNNTQTAIHDVHEPTGVVLYGQVGRNAIACWNTAKDFTESNHVTLAKDDNKLVYPADLHVDMQDEGWVITNRLPFYNYASLNPNDTNFRIHRFHIPTIIAGTSCDIRSSTARQPGYSRITRNRWTRNY